MFRCMKRRFTATNEIFSILNRNRRGVYPLLRRSLIEIPLFFLIILYVENSLFGSINGWYLSVDPPFPHPYWIGILLFSFVYGAWEGFLTGIIAAALVVNLSPVSFGWNPLEWGVNAILPCSFVMVGSLFGVIQHLNSEKSREMYVENNSLVNQIVELDQTTTRLTKSNLNLEKKIVFRLETFQSVYNIAERLNNLRLSELFQTVPELIVKYVKAKQCSFYLAEPDGSLTLKSYLGWPDTTTRPTRYGAERPLLMGIREIKETTVIEPEEIEALEIDAYFLVVLVTMEKNLLGILKIEEIDFIDVTRDNINFLSLLGKWITQSIVNGIRYAESERMTAFEPETGLVKEASFWFRVTKIVASSVRHKNEMVLLLLKLSFPEDIVSFEKNSILNTVGVIIKKVCRVDDEIGIADQGKPYHFMLVMPFTNNEQAERVMEKINDQIKKSVPIAHSKGREQNFFDWTVLALEDGSLFLSELVQDKIFNPINLTNSDVNTR